MSYVKKYKEIMQPEKRIGRSNIIPRNIYRISTYTGSEPITKVGDDSRWIFVIGIVDDKIHCIRLNDIKPTKLVEFIGKIRNKKVTITNSSLLSSLLNKYSPGGSELFEHYVKPNPHVYTSGHSTYRIYKKEKIRYIWEIRFEEDMLREIFKEGNNETLRRNIIQDEIDERDG